MSSDAKIRIRLESFSNELLISYCQQIIDVFKNNNINYLSLVTLPTNKKIYCVLRSPHVDKDSREHFELRIYRRLFEVSYNSKLNIVNLISDVELPCGIYSQILKSGNKK